MIKNGTALPYWMLTRLAPKMRTKWKRAWSFYASANNRRRFRFHKCSRNRYVSFEVNAKILLENHREVAQFLKDRSRGKLQKDELVLVEKISEEDLIAVWSIQRETLEHFHLPWMANNHLIRNATEYCQYARKALASVERFVFCFFSLLLLLYTNLMVKQVVTDCHKRSGSATYFLRKLKDF